MEFVVIDMIKKNGGHTTSRGFLRGGMAGIFVSWASRLRFPYLFLLTAVLFVLNLFIPDALPLADELVMGLVAMLLANLRKKPGKDSEEVPGDGTK